MLPYTALDALQAMLASETDDTPRGRDGRRVAAALVTRRCVRWFHRWMAGGLG